MPSNQSPKQRNIQSACPKSDALVGRCNAGGPIQRRLRIPQGLFGEEGMKRLGVENNDEVYQCSYCGVVYVSVGILGMERILGKNTPQGFVSEP